MMKELNLKCPIYRRTSRFGIFGRNDPSFTWERPKQEFRNVPSNVVLEKQTFH